MFQVLLSRWTDCKISSTATYKKHSNETSHDLIQSVVPSGCCEIIILLIKNAMSQDKVF